MPTLYALPYDISVTGFYFEDAEDYAIKAKVCRNDFGCVVEEFEIHFIDGEEIDCALAKAWGLYQSSFQQYLDAVDTWEGHQKRRYIVAVGECGYDFDPDNDDPDLFDVDLYEVDSLKELAERFVDDGLFGEIPDRFACYIDYHAIARDLACDYAMIDIAGERYAYRCA
ncbi:antirestriction protein ArdA [uncultured Hoeflea sp.]|uniref:antirestriction protein ArdA n=1 Tax=uncultured Hoeflea sp. TaxID=538666 RepID=UPI002630C5D8|nr:antirestriction protein ArdA [uncultured Hoeflea sp.]